MLGSVSDLWWVLMGLGSGVNLCIVFLRLSHGVVCGCSALLSRPLYGLLLLHFHMYVNLHFIGKHGLSCELPKFNSIVHTSILTLGFLSH